MNNDEILKAYFRKREKKDKVADKTLKDDKDVLIPFITSLNGREITEALINEYLDLMSDYTFTRNGKEVKYSKFTIYHNESILKRFLAYVNPDFGKLLAPKLPKNRMLTRKVLDQKDIEKLINACLTNRDRALISFLYESGARKGELLSIRNDNVNFDENGAVITIPEGKTGPRRIRVIFSASFLRQWIDTHPRKEDPEAFLFCSLSYPYGVLSFTGLRNQLDILADRAGIGKEIYPHLFRHSRATHLAKHLTEQELKVYLGWTAGSTMAATYVHLSGEDIDSSILKMHGVVIEGAHSDGLKVGRCPRCHELNPEKFSFCGKCGLPLTQESLTTVESIKADYMQLSDLDEIREMKNSLKQELEEIAKLKEALLTSKK
jgi:integrase